MKRAVYSIRKYTNNETMGISVTNNFGWCKLGTKTELGGSLFVLPNIYKK